MENEGIGERIKQARKKRNLTQFELAGIMGYNHSTAIASWENSKRNPSIPTIRKLAQALEINIDWLKTGEGEMLDTLTYNEQIRPLTISTNNVKLKEVGTVKAGYFASVDILGEDNTHDYPVNQLPSYAQNLSVEQMQARFFVFFVKGDSMYPTLEEGDKLIVERCEDLTKFKVGDIVIVI
jgi:transcriptional regulator with XRE-family HTH domain